MDTEPNIPVEPEDKGREIEALAQQICSKMFLPDLTIKNPKFKKSGKLEKEIADVIIPYRDSLICFQIKSKIELKPLSQKSDQDLERIRKRIDHGIGQLKTAKSCLKRGIINGLENSRGVLLPIKCEDIKQLFGIVILELIGEGNFPEDEKTPILSGFEQREDMPIHLFKLDDFKVISTEIDTIPDFVDFLEIRKLLISRGQLHIDTQELDFLALYKTRRDIINKLRDNELEGIIIEPGAWNNHISKNKDLIAERNKANIPSYLIDEMISTILNSIGFTPSLKIPNVNNLFKQGTVDNYYRSLLELSSIRRIERRFLGLKLIQILDRAIQQSQAYSFIKASNSTSPNILIYSSNQQRQERANSLFQLASLFYCGLDLTKIISIATEPGNEIDRSFDIFIMEDVDFLNAQEIKQQFINFNPKIKKMRIKEYGQIET